MQLAERLNERDFGGHVVVEVIRDGKHGPEVIARRDVHNRIVNAGKRQIWRLVTGLQTNIFDQFRIGQSGATTNSGQTNVLSAVADSFTTADSLSLLAATRTMQWVVCYPSGVGSISAASIDECVLLNQNTSPGGSCMMRSLFTAVSKTEADKLKITYSARIT
jgi:hypothetical protein